LFAHALLQGGFTNRTRRKVNRKRVKCPRSLGGVLVIFAIKGCF